MDRIAGHKGPLLWRFRDIGDLKSDPDYAAAKAGNTEAAARLVMRLADASFIDLAKQTFGRDVVYVSVHAEESSGRNKIPEVLAEYLSVKTGAGLDQDIVQSNRAYHTGANAMERLLARAEFAGEVQRGKTYVLVDDVTTMGGTLADLAGFIQSHGGEVAGSLVLTNAMRERTIIPPKNLLQKLEVRHEQAIRELFGIETSALTASEAGYLIGFRSTDELRNRGVKARQERDARILSKAVQRNKSLTPTPEGLTAPHELPPARAKPLLEQDGPILSSRENPFAPRSKVEPLSLRDSPYHTQAPESEAPFSARPRADPPSRPENRQGVNPSLLPDQEHPPPASTGLPATRNASPALPEDEMEQQQKFQEVEGPDQALPAGGFGPARTQEPEAPGPAPAPDLEDEKRKALEKEGTEAREALEALEKNAAKAPDDPAADIAKIVAQAKDAPNPFHQIAEEGGPPRTRQVFPEKRPPQVLLANPRNGKPHVKDYGDHIVVTRRAMFGMGRAAAQKREQAMTVGLQAAAERFGQPVRFEGSPAFLQEAAKQAVRLGIQLEPANKEAARVYQQELQRREQELARAKAREVVFSPSKDRTQEKTQGMGIG